MNKKNFEVCEGVKFWQQNLDMTYLVATFYATYSLMVSPIIMKLIQKRVTSNYTVLKLIHKQFYL